MILTSVPVLQPIRKSALYVLGVVVVCRQASLEDEMYCAEPSAKKRNIIIKKILLL
jgi:hypothetical protein